MKIPSKHSFVPTVFALLGALFVAREAAGVGPRRFQLESLEDMSGGELKGVAVGSDGVVRAGFTLGSTPLAGATSVFAALALADGSVLVATGAEGKVFRVAGDVATVFAETGELAVTSLAQGPSGVFAATMPNGKVFRISQGKAEPFATLQGADHVWALAYDKGMASLFAATGPEGRVFRIAADGAASTYFKSDDPHVVALAVDDATGDLFAGTSGKAILYRIKGPGRATVVQDFAGDEVKAIAVQKGIVWAVANEYAEPPEPPKRNASTVGRAAPGPASTQKLRPGKGSLYRFDAQGRPERMMNHTEFHYTALALDEAGVPYVGTGAEGRVYSVDDHHATTLVVDTDERSVGALGVARGAVGTKGVAAPLFVATGDPAVFHRVVGKGGADAVWTSHVLDAGLRARFGHLAWQASGPLRFATRTGNTAAPDETWTPWSNDLTSAGLIASAPGRYVQVRARWANDPNVTLGEVTIPFVTDNVRPIVTEVAASQKGAARESREGIQASGGEVAKHESVVKITWHVDNPDSDGLRFRVRFKRDGDRTWRDVTRADEVVTKSEYEWDAQALPEGRYRLRVEASDEPSNPADQALRHELESAPVPIDNTPPTMPTLTLQGRKLRARVVDGLGPILRVEAAVDGRLEWRPLAAADGLFDTADESVDADVSTFVPAGSHIVAVRAFDAAGNAVVREIETN